MHWIGCAGLSLGAALVSGLPAGAQSDDGFSLWEQDVSARATLVLAPDADDEIALPADHALYDLRLSGKVERILENGASVGVRAAWRLQKDNRARSGFSGVLGMAAPSGGPALQGAFSGLSAGGPGEDIGPRGQLETLFAYIEGGYGELSFGRDTGVAARFHEGAPDVFEAAAAVDPALDPRGLALVRTRHDLTGPAEKLSYVTPRYLGVRAGLSVTPDGDIRGLDRDPARALPGTLSPRIENAVELGLDASRRLRGSGLRLSAGLGWSRGDVTAAAPVSPYDTIETWSLGARAQQGGWTVGGAWLDSDNGLSGARYTAWSAGAMTEVADWALSLTLGGAEDGASGVDGETLSLGIGRDVGERVRIAAGYQRQDVSPALPLRAAPAQRMSRRDGIVIEITLGR